VPNCDVVSRVSQRDSEDLIADCKDNVSNNSEPEHIVGWKKPFNQPAKLAERVLAPGDGEAEPGEPKPQTSEPTEVGDTWNARRGHGCHRLGPVFRTNWN